MNRQTFIHSLILPLLFFPMSRAVAFNAVQMFVGRIVHHCIPKRQGCGNRRRDWLLFVLVPCAYLIRRQAVCFLAPRMERPAVFLAYFLFLSFFKATASISACNDGGGMYTYMYDMLDLHRYHRPVICLSVFMPSLLDSFAGRLIPHPLPSPRVIDSRERESIHCFSLSLSLSLRMALLKTPPGAKNLRQSKDVKDRRDQYNTAFTYLLSAFADAYDKEGEYYYTNDMEKPTFMPQTPLGNCLTDVERLQQQVRCSSSGGRNGW